MTTDREALVKRLETAKLLSAAFDIHFQLNVEECDTLLAALTAQGGEQTDTVSEVDGWRNLADELLGSLVYIRTHFGSRNPYRKNSEAYINWLSAEQEQFDIADAVIERAKGLLAAAQEGK